MALHIAVGALALAVIALAVSVGRLWRYIDVLSEIAVKQALGVESIHDYRYSMHDAKADIDAWVRANAVNAEPEAEPELEGNEE